MIQGVSVDVTINYNKLHADPKQGKSLDIVLKKVKVSRNSLKQTRCDICFDISWRC